jgi:hypothetical protein
MTVLWKWLCTLCGLVLFTMTEIETHTFLHRHKVPALPVEQSHIPIEMDGSQPLTQINVSGPAASGTRISGDVPPGQGFTGMEVARWRWEKDDIAQRKAALRFYQMNGNPTDVPNVTDNT